MPLKHSTETRLIILLAVVTMLTGIACAVLPTPTASLIPWTILCALTVAYPLSLYPLFRERRADNAFRALHLAPAAMLCAWLLLSMFAAQSALVELLRHLFTWGWSLGVVALVLFGLIWFCLDVIRQRGVRIPTIGVLFLLFMTFALFSEQKAWPTLVASSLSGSFTRASQSSATVVATDQGVSLGASHSQSEEAYRVELRRMQRRNERLAERRHEKPVVRGAVDGAVVAANVPPIPAHIGRIRRVAHDRLASSGPETQALAVFFVATYCAVLHRRAKMRLV